MPADSIAEEYTPFNHQDYQTIVGKIKRFASGGNAAVLSTINGDSNVPFYKEFANQGLRSENAPIMAFSVAEDELRGMDTSALVGHLAAWNYYQSVDTPQNKKFVSAFKEYAKKANLPGGDKRVTDDPMEAAYFGVYVWKQAVEKAKSTEVDAVRKAVYGQEFLAPGGKIKMDEANHHTYKPVLIGEILKDGQFKVVSRSKGLREGRALERVHEPGQGLRLGEAPGHVPEEGVMLRLLAALLLAWLALGAGRASGGPAEIERALADLAGEDGDRREAAVAVLGKTGDPKWLAFLTALRDGGVYSRREGGQVQVVIGGAKSTRGDQEMIEIRAAADDAPLGAVPLASLTEVAADRRLRIAIKPFLDAGEVQTQLADPDPNVRRGAALKLGRQADASAAPIVREALAREKDGWARRGFAEALALIELAHGDPAARAEAARALGGLHSLDAVPVLTRLAGDASAPPEARAAATGALRQIERWNLLGTALETLFQGASLASILLLMALGLAIVFGLMGVINMAHGELMALGAYTTFVVQNWFRAVVAAGLRRVLSRRVAGGVPGGGRGRGGARARRHPQALRPAAGDAAADVGSLADHPAGAPALVRGGQRRRRLAARGCPAGCR